MVRGGDRVIGMFLDGCLGLVTTCALAEAVAVLMRRGAR